MTVGLASASFCQIADADSWAFNDSARLPVLNSTTAMLPCSFSQGSSETSRDVEVCVDLVLVDRQRRLVGLQCLGRLAGGAQKEAEVEVAGGQGSLELGDALGLAPARLLADQANADFREACQRPSAGGSRTGVAQRACQCGCGVSSPGRSGTE